MHDVGRREQTGLIPCGPRGRSASSLGLATALLATAVALWPASAGAQPGPLELAGFHPGRVYEGYESFERVDTASGRLTLSFTDLVLPGPAGRELRFERTLSTDQYGYWRWAFGLGGLALRVDTAERIFNTADGGQQQASTRLYSHVDDIWLTDRFWKWADGSRILLLPNGMRGWYDTEGRLYQVDDASLQTLLTLDWEPQELTVTQHLGNGQERNVTLSAAVMNAGVPGFLPETMTFQGRTWTYNGETTSTQVVLPTGEQWLFDHAQRSVTTPNGGRIEYAPGWEVVPIGGGETYSFLVLRHRRTFNEHNQQTGEWTYTYEFDTAGSPSTRTTVTGPTATTIYQYATVLAAYQGRTTVLTSRSTQENSVEIEREERSYESLPIPSFFTTHLVPALSERRVIRDGITHTTTYTYDSANYANFHNPTQIVESGGGVTRTTLLQYDHSPFAPESIPYILALPKSADATVGSETVSASWTNNTSTGFRTSETVNGITTTFTPDSFGNVATSTRAGQTTSFAYSWGQVSQIQTPEYTIARPINPDGTVAAETQGGRTTTYAYDDLGRITLIQGPGGATPIMTAYDTISGRTVSTTRGASVVTTTLDGFGRPIHTVDGVQVETQTAYDALGRIIYQSYPFQSGVGDGNIGTQIWYDALGRVAREVEPDGSERTYTYGGNAATVTTIFGVPEEPNRTEVFTYESFGHPDDARLKHLQDAAGQLWTYGYTATGDIASLASPDGITRTWTYNANKLLETETHPETGQVTYSYVDGILTQKMDATGTTSTYQYDGNLRVRTITAGGQVTTITYEPGTDNVQSLTTGEVTTTFGYDDAGRVDARLDIVDGQAFQTVYENDENDDLRQVTYPSGRKVRYDYDAAHRITRVYSDTGTTYADSFGYHPSGSLTGYTAGNGIATTLDYHPRRYWVSRVQVGSPSLEFDLGYQYFKAGNVKAITDPRANMNQLFGYDALDRLTSANSAGYPSATFAYDRHGNRQGAGFTYYTNNPFRLQSLFAIGDLTYDNNGNLSGIGSIGTYQYTPDNRLAQSTIGGTTTQFAYDADGWRVKKTAGDGATTYTLRGPAGHLLSDWTVTGPTTASVRDYIYAGGRLIAAATRDDAGAPAGTSAQFVRVDATTQGTWQGTYGQQGYIVVEDGESLPAYAQVTPSGHASWTWDANTSDVRALQRATNPATRLAATWYGTTFRVDIEFLDGQPREIALYAVDWDSLGRVQDIELRDGATGALLDSRTMSDFSGGKYFVWRVSGHITIDVTRVTANAVVSGLFIGPVESGGGTSAHFVTLDTGTQGTWQGTYGQSGYVVIEDGQNLPGDVQVTPSGHSAYIWSDATSEVRALQRPSNPSTRLAATWYTYGTMRLDMSVSGSPREVAIYALDWDTSDRAQRFDVYDAATGVLLDTRTVSGFNAGKYLVWRVSGHVWIDITVVGGWNAVISGVFVDPPAP